MKPSLSLVLIAFSAFILQSCSNSQYVFMSNDLKKDMQLTEADLSKFQYYLSDDVVLYSDQRYIKKSTEEGSLVIDEKNLGERVIIPAGTKGVFASYVDANTIGVKFEDCPGCILLFGHDSEKGPYRLLAKNWNNRYGEVTYNDKKYFVPVSSSMAAIRIELKKSKQQNTQSRVAGGVLVSPKN